MKKILTCFIFSFFLLMSTFTPVQAKVNKKKLYSKYAYVYDVTSGQTLMNMKGKARIYPASMTKMMTVYTAIRLIDDLSDKVTIKNADIKRQYSLDASSAYLTKGQVVTYKDLLYGAMYPSGADACWALARSLSGSEANFVKEMNKDARRIGMNHTHFNTVTGLPDKTHYTTCEDLVKLMAKAYKNATWRSVFTGGDYYKPSRGNQVWMSTLTRMKVRLHVPADSHIMGAKSGYTKDAMYCLGSLSMVHGHLIATVTGKGIPTAQGPKKVTLACALVDHNRIISDLVKNYKSITLYQQGQKIKTFRIRYGVKNSYTYRLGDSYKMLVDKNFDENSLQKTFDGNTTLDAPLKKGQQLGTFRVSDNGRTLASITIYSGRDIAVSRKKKDTYFGVRIVAVVSVIWVIIHFIRRRILKRRYAKRKAARARRSHS